MCLFIAGDLPIWMADMMKKLLCGTLMHLDHTLQAPITASHKVQSAAM